MGASYEVIPIDYTVIPSEGAPQTDVKIGQRDHFLSAALGTPPWVKLSVPMSVNIGGRNYVAGKDSMLKEVILYPNYIKNTDRAYCFDKSPSAFDSKGSILKLKKRDAICFVDHDDDLTLDSVFLPHSKGAVHLQEIEVDPIQVERGATSRISPDSEIYVTLSWMSFLGGDFVFEIWIKDRGNKKVMAALISREYFPGLPPVTNRISCQRFKIPNIVNILGSSVLIKSYDKSTLEITADVISPVKPGTIVNTDLALSPFYRNEAYCM
jgi:hypothetical protein